jgi:hypothetical protein
MFWTREEEEEKSSGEMLLVCLRVCLSVCLSILLFVRPIEHFLSLLFIHYRSGIAHS